MTNKEKKLSWAHSTLVNLDVEMHTLMRDEKGDISAYNELLNTLAHCILVVETIEEGTWSAYKKING